MAPTEEEQMRLRMKIFDDFARYSAVDCDVTVTYVDFMWWDSGANRQHSLRTILVQVAYDGGLFHDYGVGADGTPRMVMKALAYDSSGFYKPEYNNVVGQTVFSEATFSPGFRETEITTGRY